MTYPKLKQHIHRAHTNDQYLIPDVVNRDHNAMEAAVTNRNYVLFVTYASQYTLLDVFPIRAKAFTVPGISAKKSLSKVYTEIKRDLKNKKRKLLLLKDNAA